MMHIYAKNIKILSHSKGAFMDSNLVTGQAIFIDIET